MKKIFFYCALFTLPFGKDQGGALQAQQTFFPLGTGLQNIVRNLYADTSTNILYACGNFIHAGNLDVNTIAQWNGTAWDSLGSGCNWGSVWDITKYNGEIIAGGTFNQIGGVTANGLAKWNGTNWLPFADLDNNIGSGIISLMVNNNDLYVSGWFDSIAGIPAKGIAKFDGSAWSALSVLDTTSAAAGGFSVASPVFYNGELYVIGNFWNASNGLKQIAKFDGTSWQPVGNGFSIGAITNVLAVYNNELFIGGYFSTPADPGNMLVKWNGTTYVQLPAVPDDQVLSMKVIGGKLYVGGNYSNAGGVSNTAFVSRWDGSQWESLGGVFNNGVNCFAEMNGDIYIGGGFYTVDGDSVHRIVRYTGASLGINDASTSLNMTGNVFPNPSNGEFTIKIPEEFNDAFTVCIYDVLGQVVFKDNFTSEKNIPIGISDKPKGIYFLRINSGNQQVTQKIIIE